jgi:procollagen-lysine,2-oxoglutarate 5-dioxygenase
MRIKLITTASDISKTGKLVESLQRHNWPYHVIQHEWKGFGSKIIETYNYLKTSDVTHFFYADSYDSYVIGTMGEALSKIKDFSKMLWSSEKACYPHPQLASMYPESTSEWKYLNGGGWFASKESFIKMVEDEMPSYLTVDQVYFTNQLLTKKSMSLDYSCDIFQTIAFCDLDKEFEFERGRMYNKQTKSWPIIIHGNGHTPMERIYDIK